MKLHDLKLVEENAWTQNIFINLHYMQTWNRYKVVLALRRLLNVNVFDLILKNVKMIKKLRIETQNDLYLLTDVDQHFVFGKFFDMFLNIKQSAI